MVTLARKRHTKSLCPGFSGLICQLMYEDSAEIVTSADEEMYGELESKDY
jgi:hypothetical protein